MFNITWEKRLYTIIPSDYRSSDLKCKALLLHQNLNVPKTLKLL